MEIPRHWRMKKIRLGNPDEWKKIIDRYRDKELNPHLSLALLASDLSHETLVEIHDRLKSHQEQSVIFKQK
jgi:hypothetical protein